jgi:hypothetical protein
MPLLDRLHRTRLMHSRRMTEGTVL